jgi:RHS repeat-associated protein
LANIPRGSLVAEKPHPGVESFALVGHRGAAAAKALSAAGLCGYSYDSGRRSRSTGKERDAETGLDYFGARYMSAAQGRFTSPDPLPGWEKDPQSWNMYSYGRNNPLKYIDPTGETYEVCDANGQNCGTISDAQFDKFRKDKNLNFRGGSSGSIYAGDALSGTFRQTDVDLDPGVAQALHAAGVVADREVKKFARDVAITAATGVVFSGAAAAVAKIGSAVPENLPLLRQVSEVVSKGNLKHILQRHLGRFQELNPGMTADDIVSLGIDVAQTGKQVAGNAFVKTVEIGGKEVTVRAILNPNNGLRSVHVLE